MSTLKSLWQRICLATLVAMVFALFNPMLVNTTSAAPSDPGFVFPPPWQPLQDAVVEGVSSQNMTQYFKDNFSDGELLAKYGLFFGSDKAKRAIYLGVPGDKPVDIMAQLECLLKKPHGENCTNNNVPQFVRDIPYTIPAGKVVVLVGGAYCWPYQLDLDSPTGRGRAFEADLSKCETPPPPPPVKTAECKSMSANPNPIKVGEEFSLSIDALNAVTYLFRNSDGRLIYNGSDNHTDHLAIGQQGKYMFMGSVIGEDGKENSGSQCQVEVEVVEITIPKCETTIEIPSPWSVWQPVPGQPGKSFRTRTISIVDVNDHSVICGSREERQEISTPPPPTKDATSKMDCSEIYVSTLNIFSKESHPETIQQPLYKNGNKVKDVNLTLTRASWESKILDFVLRDKAQWYNGPGQYRLGDKVEGIAVRNDNVPLNCETPPDQPPPPPGTPRKEHPDLYHEEIWGCNWVASRVSDTEGDILLKELRLNKDDSQNMAVYPPSKNAEVTPFLTATIDMEVDLVFAPVKHSGEMKWWRKGEEAWYDTSDPKKVVYEHAALYEAKGTWVNNDNQVEQLTWSWIVKVPNYKCSWTPETPPPPQNQPVINRCPDRIESAPVKGAEGQKAVDAQAPNSEVTLERKDVLDHGHAYGKWMGKSCEIPSWDLGQHRRDDIIVYSCHKFGVCGNLRNIKPGDRGVYVNLETGERHTIEATASRPTKRGSDEYVNPEQLHADVTMFTCHDPKMVNGKWAVATSWVVTWKFVD